MVSVVAVPCGVGIRVLCACQSPSGKESRVTRYLAVSKFDQHQHYKRNLRPTWIKFYTSLLDPHHPLNELPIATRYTFDRMLLLAANYGNAIPNDYELIAKLLRMPLGDCAEALEQLKKGRWIHEKQTPRTSRRQASRPKVVVEVEEEEKPPTPLQGKSRPEQRHLSRSYPCPQCSVSCITRADLEAHMENMHGVAA